MKETSMGKLLWFIFQAIFWNIIVYLFFHIINF